MISINRKISILKLAVLCTVFSGLCASAQGVYIYDSKKGLSNSQIQSLYEDSHNNIWITTRNGLNRFDGVKINTYRHSNKDTSSILHDNTTCVFEYDNHTLFVGTDAGLQAYDYNTNKFTTIPCINQEGDTVFSHIISINKVSEAGTFACIAGVGTVKITKNKDNILVANLVNDFNTGSKDNLKSPIRIYQDKKGRIWLIREDGHVYLRQGNRTDDIPGCGPRPRIVCESSSGNIYLCSQNSALLHFSEKNRQFEPVNNDIINYNIWSISPWTEGRIFVSTDGNGLKVYDEHTGLITQSPIQMNDFDLHTSNVKDVLCDSFGSVWVGIYWMGVMQKPANNSAFNYAGKNSISRNTIGSNSVTAIEPSDDGMIWIATDHGGLYKTDLQCSRSEHWDNLTTPNMPSTINAICRDNKRGRIWLGSFAGGLRYMDVKTHKAFTTEKQIPHVFDICRNEEDNLWVATIGQGIFFYNPTNGQTINYTTPYRTPDNKETGILANDYVPCILQKGNRLYVGTADGLEIYSISDGNKLKRVSRCIHSSYVNALKYDDGKIWAATSKGLYIVDENSLNARHYDMDNGLPNTVVNSIEFDGNEVWLGTDFGLACMEKKTGTFHNFFVEDGLQNNEFAVNVSSKIGTELYFGGISGLNFFTTESVTNYQGNKAFKIRINDLYLNTKQTYAGDMSGSYQILDCNINEATTINLAHDDNHFTLEMATLGLSNSHAIYEYSLNDGPWTVQSEQSNNIVFANLKPGTHSLKIRARVYQSYSEEKEITVIVHEPWYFSPIAWLVYLLMLIVAIYLGWEYVHRQVTARRILANHRKEEEMNEARIQFFMNISHEIRTPMTLIFAPLEKLMSSDKDEEHQRNYRLIHQNSKRIMRLINQMMDARKIEKGQYKLEFRPVELVDYIHSICDVFTTNAQNRNIRFDFLHSMETLYAKADPENLDKIIMNLLSNAFKFTPDGGKITLCLTTENGNIIIKVTDTGSGISDADKPKIFERFYSAQHQNGYIGTGIGLNLTYLIVQMHKGEIAVNDNPEGRGSQFVITLPLIDAKASDTIITPEPATPKEETVNLPIEKLKGVRHRNVLVVEDDEAIRSYIHSELSSDMVITECNNGQEGWDYLQKNPDKVDLIISDVMMPVMDGLTMCQKVKQNFNTNHIPVILITALGSDSDRIAGITNGADAYVTKPFNIDVLRSTAINLLVSRLALQGKFSTMKKTEEQIEKREILSADEHLLNRVIKVINQNMEDPELSVEVIADKVGISRVHFYRKMKELTGQSPRDFLKTIRLKEAARLLSEKRLDITSVCAATGFKTLSTFSTSFKSVYGLSPSEYANSKLTEE